MDNATLKARAMYQTAFMDYLAKDLADDMPETAKDISELCAITQALVDALDKEEYGKTLTY